MLAARRLAFSATRATGDARWRSGGSAALRRQLLERFARLRNGGSREAIVARVAWRSGGSEALRRQLLERFARLRKGGSRGAILARVACRPGLLLKDRFLSRLARLRKARMPKANGTVSSPRWWTAARSYMASSVLMRALRWVKSPPHRRRHERNLRQRNRRVRLARGGLARSTGADLSRPLTGRSDRLAADVMPRIDWGAVAGGTSTTKLLLAARMPLAIMPRIDWEVARGGAGASMPATGLNGKTMGTSAAGLGRPGPVSRRLVASPPLNGSYLDSPPLPLWEAASGSRSQPTLAA